MIPPTPMFWMHGITHGFELLFHLSFSDVNCLKTHLVDVLWSCMEMYYGQVNLPKGKYCDKRQKKQKAKTNKQTKQKKTQNKQKQKANKIGNFWANEVSSKVKDCIILCIHWVFYTGLCVLLGCSACHIMIGANLGLNLNICSGYIVTFPPWHLKLFFSYLVFSSLFSPVTKIIFLFWKISFYPPSLFCIVLTLDQTCITAFLTM